MNYLALATFVIAGVLSAVQLRRPALPRFVPFFLFIMLSAGTFWTIIGFDPLEYKNAFGTGGPLLFIMCVGVYAGRDSTLWQRFPPIVLGLAYASAALGAYYAIRLGTTGPIQGASPMNRHMPTALWLSMSALALRKSSSWRDCLPVLVPIALCIPIAIVINTRSFTLLATIALLTGLMIPLHSHFRSTPLKLVMLGFLAALVLGVGISLLFLAAPERVLSLHQRLTSDTRSSQYRQFFAQVPVTRLITGMGPKATYVFKGENYEFIDNQFLFILFKFGFPVLLGYCAIVLWPGLRVFVNATDRRERSMGLFFVFWVLAALGLSIFHGIVNNPQNLLAILLAGRCFAAIELWGSSGGTPRNRVRSTAALKTFPSGGDAPRPDLKRRPSGQRR
jgi:hypothetical protein